MNPARSLAPAIVSVYYIDWLYLTAPFIGTSIVALLLRIKFFYICRSCILIKLENIISKFSFSNLFSIVLKVSLFGVDRD